MEKIFNMKIRMGWELEFGSEGYRVTDKFYYGDGYLRIKDDEVFGYITTDLMKGKITNTMVEMQFYYASGILAFSIPKEEFILLGTFIIIVVEDYFLLELSIEGMVKSPKKARRINEEIQKVGKLYFP